MERTPRVALPIAAFAWIMCGITSPCPAATIEDYGRLPQVELLRVSPSGERVATIGVAGDKRQLLVVQLAGNKVLKAIAVGDSKVRDVNWAGDEHVLVTVSITLPARPDFVGRFELYGDLVVGLNGQAPWRVFEKYSNIEHATLGYYGSSGAGGHWSGYFGGVTLQQRRGFGDYGYVREHDYADLYRVDLDTGNAELVTTGGQRDHEWTLAPDGSVVAFSDYETSGGEWVLYGGADRKRVLLKKVTPTYEIGLNGLGRTTGTVLVTDRTGPVDLVHEIDVTTAASQDLFGDHAVDEYLYDPLTDLLLGAITADETGATFFDPTLQKRYDSTRKAFPDQQVRLKSFTSNLNQMVVFTEGTHDSGTFWFVNAATHHADPLGYAYPNIKPEDVGTNKVFAYRAEDGLGLEGILTLPAGREPNALPLIVLPHGGPIGIHDQLGFDWWAQAFASRGYAVLQPNYRGSSGYSSDFRRAGYGQWGRKMLSDIASGAAELARQHIVDPQRVCIVGASYGGYAALAGVTLQQHLYRCAVSVAGPANLTRFKDWLIESYGLNGTAGRGFRKETGADAEGDGILRDLSPTTFAARADAPILLIHGKDDTRVPIEQSRQMATALKAAGKPYEFVELEKEDHFLSREVTRTQMLKAAIGFVEKYNPPQ